ncbi:hypothetical protein C8F04DRAFT_1132062 [Mycena alexandri]|uniref:F-box domain-containing protein n=1 Tax=Mycena alexandri TaxID=1745969 RepID=A0AAD6WTF5_9AGAR|nr:hypothetical protein C8F04DRAFT_1132062 [Mycena alexandri]
MTGPRSKPDLAMDIYARLPAELHEYIIAQLWDDRHALSECSLVCSHWSAASRYHLFQHATIRLITRTFSSSANCSPCRD